MDEVQEDKISSIILGAIAFIAFVAPNLAAYQNQAAGFLSVLPIPEAYLPIVTLAGALAVGGIAYWNFKTPAKREEAAYQAGLETPCEVVEEVAVGDTEDGQ